jgi:hypothetical protein
MRFAIGATYALAAAVVRADDASAAEAESSTSTSVAKPTFTVRARRWQLSLYQAHIACIAYQAQGAVP